MHLLEQEIILNKPAEHIWQFMATPSNLNELTPPELKFYIVSQVPEEMYNGLMIEYRISILSRVNYLVRFDDNYDGRLSFVIFLGVVFFDSFLLRFQ